MDNGKGKIITKKIKTYGIVQGVGFRPLVYRTAKNLNIKGYVKNVGGYVEITAQAENEVLDVFIADLMSQTINGCEIIKLEITELPDIQVSDFTIIHSEKSEEISILPPDLPICAKCSEELFHNRDRRFRNPFISCMSCGPRYTIMEELPYDRQNTTMKDFEMCTLCHEEYSSPESRRFHAQTISCDDCGPYLIYQVCTTEDGLSREAKPLINKGAKPLINQKTKPLTNQAAYDKAVSVLKKGGIVAVKGIGGYHFVCSPFMEEPVVNLRKLKGREEKPFAVMFPSLEEIEKYCSVTEEEKALLQTSARPIVLLYMNKNPFAPSAAKSSVYCGAFLPYTPLQLMLTAECGPLIMTSANVSDQPVIKEDDKLMRLTSSYLNGILYNRRRIVRSVDDSVAKVIDGKPQLIRRSRGYVPYPVFINQDNVIADKDKKPDVIFAAGGDLKAAFCLYQSGKAVVSQYFGDLAEVSVREEFQKAYADLTGLLKMKPELAVCDLHPNYISSHFTKSLNIPILPVQHHHAHIASVMAEHDLRGKVIGVAFDGTGYGTDGNIWGGEFLVCEGAEFTRAAHLSYAKILGGDQSMRDAGKTATCYLLDFELNEFVKDDRRDVMKAALDHRINTILTSSMGRLFDAVAALLELGQENRYEGECAALLEKEALFAKINHINPEKLSFAISEKDEIIEIDPKPLLEALCRLREKQESSALALGFHIAVAKMIAQVCDRLRKKLGSNTVALSGGVFQNTVLTEQTFRLLRETGFDVYVNMAVPPNDGGISLGQTYIALMGRQQI